MDAPTEILCRKVLAVCAANNINTDAALDTFLQGLTTIAQFKTLIIGLVEGLVSVGPP